MGTMVRVFHDDYVTRTFHKMCFSHEICSNVASESFEEEKILTPVTDAGNLGGLVPVSPLDQTLDDMLVTLPNYLDVSNS